MRRNALPKLTDQCPNLVVAVDDLRVPAVGLPRLAELVQREYLKPNRDPDDPNDVYTYERLGGILFLLLEQVEDSVYYRTDFVQNPGAVSRCALPPPAIAILCEMRDQSRLRTAQRYAGVPSVFDIAGTTRHRG